VAAVLALVAVGAFLWARRADRAAPRERPHVLLVTIDTLRADAVSAYGNPAASTPVLDALAARGARFTTAVANVPLTGPSHASILTGLIPVRHGVRDNGGFVLPDEVPVLTERFRDAGYRTAAFVSGYPLVRRFGFGRGFDTYDDSLPHGNDPRRAPYVERSADRTTDLVLRWLEAPAAAPADGGTPWFLWVHYYDPHAPYEPPGDLATRFAARPYYGEAAFVDRQLGRLLRRLDERGWSSRTLVLVTSDHGESLGEHGEDSHGIFVYDSTLRVPWIMAGPGIPAGGMVDTVARLVDVAPTLLECAGIAGPGDVDGRSLCGASAGRPLRDEPTYAESLSSLLHMGWAPLHAWRTRQWKLIEAPRLELYDLEKDPAEAHNLAGERPDLVQQMRRPLQAAMSAPTPLAAKAVDAEAAERLAALGYVGGASVPPPADGSARKDPKDHIDVITRLERGMSRARMDPASAIRDLSAVVRQDPGITVARRYRAVAYAAAGRPEAALADLDALEKEEGLSAEDLIVLADCLRASGRSEEALGALERAARLQPKSPQPLLSRGNVLLKEGRNEEAAVAFEGVLSVAPGHIEALRGLGDLAVLRGDHAAAAERYGDILRLDPGDAGAMVKLGVLRMRGGGRDEAIALFRRAVEREPRNAEALLYLAGALAASGRHAEAVPFFERALAAGPRTTMALNGLALTLLELGDRPAAAKALRESLALDSRQPGVARTLAEVGTTTPAR
jgi:arylsulfatase A-like enzyme/tetratricopeptide (TPR) repeat protein